jgi:hypothetical protein
MPHLFPTAKNAGVVCGSDLSILSGRSRKARAVLSMAADSSQMEDGRSGGSVVDC